MRPYRVGMRWWLAGIFVVIAAVTAALVATVSSRQADIAIRSNSEDIAVGKTVSAAFAIERAIGSGTLATALPTIARRRELALFVFGSHRQRLSVPRSGSVEWQAVPNGDRALSSALAGHRFVETSQHGGATLVALPLRRTPTARALVAYAPRPAAYGKSLAIFRHEVLRAALWAVLVAAAAGLLAAALIARRLRRIAAAAAAIETGDFDVELNAAFPDEVGSLALAIDRMRQRLGASFEQLRAERDRLGRLLGQLNEGVVAVDTDLVVRFANASATALLGEDVRPGLPLPPAWCGLRLAELGHGLFRSDAEVAEARIETDDGRTLSVAGVPAGASDLAVIVLADITEQERRERAEREFVANASHELRTPLTAIAGAVEALQAGAKDEPAERDAFIDLIGRQAARLGRLTRSLLIMARAQTHQEAVQLEPLRLSPLLEEIASASVPPDRVDVRVDCPPELAALGQRDIAEQIVSNLLGNALKHTSSGSVVLSARRRGAAVAIEVADTGPGIPARARQRIFDRFYSGDSGARDGFGLGLAIARDGARALGGSIEIESEPGRGTVARVILAGGARQ
jgi:signal transduction histidine kinase/HAMP domain-containing protein